MAKILAAKMSVANVIARLMCNLYIINNLDISRNQYLSHQAFSIYSAIHYMSISFLCALAINVRSLWPSRGSGAPYA